MGSDAVSLERDLGRKLCAFIDASPSPFHAAATAAGHLREAGYVPISERENWVGKLEPGGKYYFTRNASSIVAFAVGDAFDPAAAYATVLGAHTDSPCFRIKPVSKISKNGYAQLGVQTYGGGLWHTWFDRDLSVAGRVVLADGTVKRVHLKRPVCRIPNLAIHLNRTVRTDGFNPNQETHCVPILAIEAVSKDLLANGADSVSTKKLKDKSLARSRHSPKLLEAIAKDLEIAPDDIVDLELCLTDTQGSAIGGVSSEFIFAPRIDNLASCFAGLEALILSSDTLSTETGVRVLVLFDHEEVGSVSSHGAASTLLSDALERIFMSLAKGTGHDIMDYGGYSCVLQRSLFVSADMAHGVHPNYASRHEINHRVTLGGGLVVKTNANQRYATSLVSGYIVRECARLVGSPVQEFVVPNDTRCGSTIGPSVSAKTGLRTVDVGMPQLSMHSVREMASVEDLNGCVRIYKSLFEQFRRVDKSMANVEAAE